MFGLAWSDNDCGHFFLLSLKSCLSCILSKVCSIFDNDSQFRECVVREVQEWCLLWNFVTCEAVAGSALRYCVRNVVASLDSLSLNFCFLELQSFAASGRGVRPMTLRVSGRRHIYTRGFCLGATHVFSASERAKRVNNLDPSSWRISMVWSRLIRLEKFIASKQEDASHVLSYSHNRRRK